MLLDVNIDLSVIIGAIFRVTTKPVIGTAEIAKKSTVLLGKVAAMLSANLKKAQREPAKIGKIASVLLDV